MKFKKYISYAAVICLLLAAVFSGMVLRANAAEGAAISYSASKTAIIAGDSFDINVNLSNVSNLYGASIDFKYDPALLQITGISKGSIFGTANSGTPVNDKSNGLISFYTILQGKAIGVSSTSSKALFVIHAKALKGGSVSLKTIASNDELSNTGNNVRIKLVDSTEDNSPITYTSVSKTFNVGSSSPVSISSLTTDKASPQIIGAKIKLTANVTGGSSRLYRFSVLEGTTWKVVRDYSSANYFTWTPTRAGSYKVKTEVKDGTSGKPVAKEISYTINSGITFSSFKADRTSPQQVNTKIKLTANASGSANLVYKFSTYDGTSWKTLRDYASTNYYYWTPTKAAKYTLKAEVKDNSTGKIVSRSASYTISSSSSTVAISSVKTSLTSPQVVGAKITITANASGGSSRLYKFRIYDGSLWKTVKNYSSSYTYSWTPTKAAAYKIRVYVKDSKTGKIVSKEISYTISSGIKVTAISTSKASPQRRNTTITLTAKGSGSANILYKFLTYDGRYWKVLRDFSTSKTYSWKPTKAANYKIRVDAKDVATGKKAYRQIYYKIS
jgi:hypothetical protein